MIYYVRFGRSMLDAIIHMNGYFVGAVIYADDITLLGPTGSSIL